MRDLSTDYQHLVVTRAVGKVPLEYERDSAYVLYCPMLKPGHTHQPSFSYRLFF